MAQVVSREEYRIAGARKPGSTGLRLVLAVLVFAVTVPLVLFAAFLIQGSWSDQLEIVDRQNVDTARAISVAIDKEVERAQAALQVVASLNILNEPDFPRFEALALRLIPSQSGWRSVLLASPAGDVLFDSAAQPSERSTVRDTDWLPEVLASRRTVVSNLFTSQDGEYLFAIAVPVIRSGAVNHVLAAQVRARRLSDVLRRQNTPPSGVVTLLDGRGTIMARTRGEADYVGGRPSDGFLAARERMREGAWRETLLEGTPAYAALSRSPITGWTLGLAVEAEEIDGIIRRSYWLLSVAGALTLGLGSALAIALGERIVRSLRAASGAVHALARGQPVAVRASRITEFDHLAAGVRDAAAILDARLRERDEALAAERSARAVSEAQEARLAVTLQSIGDAVVATDAKGRVTMLNPVAQALTGCTEADAQGQPIGTIVTIVHETARQPVENPVTKVLREETVVGMAGQMVLMTRDGREVPIEDSAAPIRGADGTLIGAVLVFRDVTDKRRADLERQALLEREQTARREAEMLSRSKDEFVATVSHELRTPLHAIFGWVRLLRDSKLDEAGRRRAIAVLERNTRMQAQLIDDLLDMSRVLAGHLRLEVRRVDVTPVLEAALDVIRPAAQAKDIELVLEVHEEASVSADPDRLQQIVWNLLANSVKFTPKGGHVELGLGVEDDDAVITVVDDGIGIAPDLLPHVFERFRRGGSDAASRSGLGIGLALVEHLVAQHGGTVSAASEGEQRGSTFAVRLPLAKGSARPAAAREPQPPVAAARLRGRRVLVVDDDADARELVATVLDHAGAEVAQAASVADALQEMRSARPDVVVCDIAMPGASGYEFVAQVRTDRETANTVVIALTAYSRLEDRERALEAGFDDHVGKPVEPNALIGSIVRRL